MKQKESNYLSIWKKKLWLSLITKSLKIPRIVNSCQSDSDSDKSGTQEEEATINQDGVRSSSNDIEG